MLDGTSALRVLRATRELCHATSHVADTAAELARRHGAEDTAHAALQASLDVARAAFDLDDALRVDPIDKHGASVALALAALDRVERAMTLARAALQGSTSSAATA